MKLRIYTKIQYIRMKVYILLGKVNNDKEVLQLKCLTGRLACIRHQVEQVLSTYFIIK